MTREEQILRNAKRGYLHVAEFDGYDIWKKQNEVGAWTYYCDKVGNEGAFVLWDTALYGEAELEAILFNIKSSGRTGDNYRKGFKRGDVVRFSRDYFTLDDLGASGIVAGPQPGAYQDELYTFIGYIEGDTSGRAVVVNKNNRALITVDSSIEKSIQ